MNNDFIFLNSRNNSNIHEITEIVKYYNDQNRFFESFSYLQKAIINPSFGNLFYETLTNYLNWNNFFCLNETPLLITWTIKPKNVPYLAMADPNIRFYESVKALSAWILDKSFKNIVIVDSSGFSFNVEKLKEIGKFYGKNIEYQTFVNSDNVSIFGKGYGEGEILKFALENIDIIKNCSKFVKITGKLFAPFYEFYYMNNTGCFEFFDLQNLGSTAIDTKLYCVDREYYVTNLLNKYEKVDDHNQLYLEHIFYESTKNRVNFYLPQSPIVFGVQGSTNRNYGNFPPIVEEFCNELIKEII